MTNEQKVTKWLEDNTKLSWTRVGNDTPAVKLDRLYINRSEAYEIRDFILKICQELNLMHSDKNFGIFYKDIMGYKQGEKVKSQELFNYLKKKYNK